MFVIDEIERSGKPGPGDIAIMMTFGPGLTMEGFLLQW
jgi:predicted naringenin-chalcone synthase